MQRKLALGLIALGALVSTYAHADQDVKQIALKDDTALVVFKDGKMSMRDKFGNVVSMKDGVPMETKEGQVIVMKGNEIWRRTDREKLYDELYRGR